jgi:hypothetical protein
VINIDLYEPTQWNAGNLMFWIEQRLNSYYEGIMVGFMPQVSLFLLVVRLFVWKRKTILTFHNIMQYPNNIIIGWYPVHDGISQKNGYQSYYNEIFQHSTCIIVISHYIQIYIYIYPILTFHGIPLDHFFVVISWIYHMSSSHPAAGATAVGHLNPAYGWPGWPSTGFLK